MGIIDNTKNLFISLAYYVVICLFFLLRNLVSKRFHKTKCTKIEEKGVIVWTIPSLLDNYSYLIIDNSTKQACAVDAVDPTQLLSLLKQEGATLQYILTTHHHWDHSGGNHELALRLWNSHPRIVGSELDQHRIPAINYPVKHEQEISLGNLKIKPLWTPCHTKGHLVYHIESKDSSLLFTGDTLFIGGCGKFFEGSGAEMYHSLINVIGKLPLETKIYCGHEYTVKNLEFASSVDPTNEAITAKLSWAKEQRKKELPTVPSTVSEEMVFNPFMRCEAMKQKLNCATGTDALSKLRKMKDDWIPPTASKRE